ncbi:DUF4304 domain-containing protein [Paractinoplanes durhamensis]|uniref:DUF4304 domain-containing protein n=1 Tax=Paractinoplanes durhamensis TaxID=113563 RepID=A0ABQ3YZE1_9ACTN|nr:DUF4304 domain-containing protein [Actinoplanes durhamensis]GIE02945.1 hypothetical protein Adu01nite_42950 [Actinoplanes durhamensis]
MPGATVIDQIVRNHLAPALQAEGFVRKGRTFRRVADNGDALLIEVQTASGSRRDEARFFLNIAVLSQPWLGWLSGDHGPVDTAKSVATDGTVQDRIRSDENPQWSADTFVADQDDVDRVGAAAAAAVRSSLPEYLPLLDRAKLLAILRDGAPVPGFCNRLAVRAVLAADAGDAETARADVAEVDRESDDTEFVDWIAGRL